MIVPFESLPQESRIWIYPSNRPFQEEELVLIKDALSHFLSEWTAHDQALEAAFKIPYNRFIVLGLN